LIQLVTSNEEKMRIRGTGNKEQIHADKEKYRQWWFLFISGLNEEEELQI